MRRGVLSIPTNGGGESSRYPKDVCQAGRKQRRERLRKSGYASSAVHIFHDDEHSLVQLGALAQRKAHLIGAVQTASAFYALYRPGLCML